MPSVRKVLTIVPLYVTMLFAALVATLVSRSWTLTFNQLSVFDPLQTVWALLLAALAAMYTLELLKVFLSLRGMSHVSAIRRYLDARAQLLPPRRGSLTRPEGESSTVSSGRVARAAWRELLQSLGRTHWYGSARLWIRNSPGLTLNPVVRVFDLRVEQLMAQVSSAVQWSFEGQTQSLHYLLSGLSDSSNAQELRYLVDRGVDELGAYIADQWNRQVRFSAILISGAYATLIGALIAPGAAPLYSLLGIFLAGPLSWTLRDVVAAIQRLRSR